MKIRIKGNSLRFRLTKPEVARLSERGIIREQTKFPSGHVWEYGLQTLEINTIQAKYSDGNIWLHLPVELVRDWADSETITLEKIIQVDDHHRLDLLIEKDFACLKPREGEDESDHFDNPLDGVTCQ